MAELSRQYSAGIGSGVTRGQLLIAQTPLTIDRAVATGAVDPVLNRASSRRVVNSGETKSST